MVAGLPTPSSDHLMPLKIKINRAKITETVNNLVQKVKMESSAQYHSSNEYIELYGRVPWKVQLAYGMGHVLNDVCASMWFTYLLVFFHLVLQFNNWETGVMMLVGQIADAVATPFIGYHSDQSDGLWIWGYGRRKIWHLVGTVCVLGAFPFIFSPCLGCASSHDWAQMFYYSMFIIIFQFGWAAVQISHLSFIPELTPNEHDRTQLTAVRYCFTVVSNVLVYVVTWIVLHLDNGGSAKIGPADGPKFQHVVWSVISFGGLCSLLFHLSIREPEEGAGNNIRGGQLRTSVADLFTNVRLYQIAVIYMSSRLFVNLTQVFVPLYLHETLDMAASSLALVPLTMFVGSFATSLLIERINRWLGRRLTYCVGALLGVAACVWIKFGEGQAYMGFYIYLIALLIGSSGSIVLVGSLGITTDFIGDKTGSGAFVYGIMSFTDKLANGVAVVLIQYIHSDASNLYFYRDVLTNVCGGSIVLGAVAVIGCCSRATRSGLMYQRVPHYDAINN